MGLHLIRITGTVQGVGFRPFVYRLASEMGVTGSIRNDSAGVTILLSGDRPKAEQLAGRIEKEAPPASFISAVSLLELEEPPDDFPPLEAGRFSIIKSRADASPSASIPPDLYVCSNCIRELFDPSDRRYLYPFINCTDCGPRYSIIESLPYDRPNTSMARFRMCRQCRLEYEDPLDRRFHAQPVACPQCGPSLTLCAADGQAVESENPVSDLMKALKSGRIAAVKGLGGFHLAADAFSQQAVELLRKRKGRRFKPFAVMIPSMEALRRYCIIPDQETERLLLGPQAPIVLLPKRNDAPVCSAVAPGVGSLGVMLPYTPIHHLMFAQEDAPECLVMTSANLTSEPICKENREALERLSGIADLFVMHDRPIVTRLDDSVAVATDYGINMVRRARGYVPLPLRTDLDMEPVLAFGADLKTTICLARKGEFVVSQHLGDASHASTLEFLEETRNHLSRLLEFDPKLVACDRHPDYFTARLAGDFSEKKGLPLFKVQHHHAHAAAVAAEHGLTGPFIACILDGTGWGDDGTVWGGEIFVGSSVLHLKRRARLERLRLPGGDRAARQPWRMAVSALQKAFGTSFMEAPAAALIRDAAPEKAAELTARMVQEGINSPWTSSCGRLFDAVSSLLGICHENEYEAQAAMELEAAADSWFASNKAALKGLEGLLPERHFRIDRTMGRLRSGGELMVIGTAPMIRWLADRRQAEESVEQLAAAFHLWLARELSSMIEILGFETGIGRICLSGGCFMNRILFNFLTERLKDFGFSVYWGQRFPMNDGGISLGQAYIGAKAASA